MKKRPLTPKQKETLDFIDNQIKSNGFAPTLVEIGKAFGINFASASDRVMQLELKGYIKREHGIPRSIEVL